MSDQPCTCPHNRPPEWCFDCLQSRVAALEAERNHWYKEASMWEASFHKETSLNAGNCQELLRRAAQYERERDNALAENAKLLEELVGLRAVALEETRRED